MRDVAILIPVLRRPHKVAGLVASIEAATPERHRILFLCTIGDTEEIAAVEAAGVEHIDVPPLEQGDYASKIQTGFDATDEPFVFTGADDILFHPGWLPAARNLMSDTVGVVGTNDLGSPRVMAGEHATHFLFARWYVDQYGTIDQPGRVFHPGYWHDWLDDEAVGTAKHRGAWAYAHDSHVEHMHPDWGKGERDPLYARSGRRRQFGYRVFAQRQHLWSGGG